MLRLQLVLKSMLRKNYQKWIIFLIGSKIQVDLDIEPVANEEDRQIASATVFVPGSAIIAKESSKDLYASIDGMIDKLQRQLKKYKDKLRLKNRHDAKKQNVLYEKWAMTLILKIQKKPQSNQT